MTARPLGGVVWRARASMSSPALTEQPRHPTRLQVDGDQQAILRTVREAASEAWLAGGAVRDLLRGSRPSDLDFVTSGDARDVAEKLAISLGGRAFALDAERGQWRVALEMDVVKSIDVGQVESSIEADLRRRDFTVNAMAAPVEIDATLGEVIDLAGGQADIEARLLRMVNESNLREDPLRTLRAVRLAIELGFEIEKETAEAIKRHAGGITTSAAERQREELTRMLATDRAAEAVRLMDALGLLEQALPELMPAKGVGQPGEHHYWDVFDHSVETLAALDAMLEDDKAPNTPARLKVELREALAWYPLREYLDEDAGGHSRRVLLKLAGLLHDVSKPETKGIDADGRIHFLGHPELGAEKAARICERLRFGSRETKFVALLVEEHLRPTMLSARGEPPSARALYRFYRDLGDAAPACLLLMLADGSAAAGPRLTRERWRTHVAFVSYLLERGQEHIKARKAARLVTGDDLIEALGMTPGPELGRVLAAVDEAIGAGEVRTREEALSYAKRVMTSPPAPSPLEERGKADAPLKESGEAGAPPVERGSAEVEARWPTRSQLWERLKPIAREFRHRPTAAEDRLWQALRRGALGFHFRRQHAIDRFIVDFYCPKAKLVVEVDGTIHDLTKLEAKIRQDLLESLDLRVLQFSNEQIFDDLEPVLGQIRHALSGDSGQSPSVNGEEEARQGRGKGTRDE
ncbi:MAG: DUF559 domain-containing protein [Dehalococcoidia bacterium]|nr:DUF559 domain-containing protein [Dehalococcoidia bacterium]